MAELERSYDAFVRSQIPALVTVRSEAEGGYCPVEEYADTVSAAISLAPEAIDVEARARWIRRAPVRSA